MSFPYIDPMPRTTTKPTRKPGQPRKSEYPAKLGPYRLTQASWDLLDKAAKVSGITKREIAENGVAAEARRIIEAHSGGTTNGTSSPAHDDPG